MSSLYYIDTFGDETNLDSDTDPNSPASLRRDPAYNASINIIADVTSDDSSVDEVVDVIDMLKGRDDAIDILSEVDKVDRDSVIEIIDGYEEGEGDNTTRDEPSDGQDSSSSESIDTDKLSYHNYGIGRLDFDTMPIEALDSTYHWDKDIVTFSFNQTIPDSYDMDIDDIGWEPLNGEQQDTVRDVTLEVNNLVDS